MIVTGSMLAVFQPDPNLPQRAEGQDTGHHHGPPKSEPVAAAAAAPAVPPPLPPSATAAAAPTAAAAAERADEGTVVGSMQSSNAVHTEQAVAVGGVKAMPAVRATAKKLGVDLSRVRATGADGAVTMADVKRAGAYRALTEGGLADLAGRTLRHGEAAQRGRTRPQESSAKVA